MCVLLAVWRLSAAWPLVVAANRDEVRDRPASPPGVLGAGGSALLAPRDLRAGGTWEGASARGLVAVITNRPDGDHDARRPSRGEIVAAVLEQADAGAARACVAAAVARRRYNSFNLFYADRDQAFVSSWNGRFATHALPAGVHVLTNVHALGELDVPEAAEAAARAGDLSRLRAHLLATLRSHADRDARGFRLCKHGESYGTVSSSLVFLPARGLPWIEYAPGPPCESSFATYRLAPAPPGT